MKNKTIVKIFTIAMLLVILASATSVVFGYLYDDETIGTISKGEVSEVSANVSKAGNMIIGIVQVVGIAVAVVMLIWLGVKYISAAPAEKADVKKGAMIYVVGAVFILLSTAVLQVIKNLSQDIKLTE